MTGRREDDAERRAGDFDARVGKRERLGVPDPEVDREPRLGRLLLRRLDQRRGEVDAHDVRATTGCTDREVAGAARHVQPLRALGRTGGLDDRVVDVGDRLRDMLERGAAPHKRVPFLQLLERHLPALFSDRPREHDL
jgi:hypothetical protein